VPIDAQDLEDFPRSARDPRPERLGPARPASGCSRHSRRWEQMPRTSTSSQWPDMLLGVAYAPTSTACCRLMRA